MVPDKLGIGAGVAVGVSMDTGVGVNVGVDTITVAVGVGQSVEGMGGFVGRAVGNGTKSPGRAVPHTSVRFILPVLLSSSEPPLETEHTIITNISAPPKTPTIFHGKLVGGGCDALGRWGGGGGGLGGGGGRF